MCPYAYYDERESKPRLYCKLKKDSICLFSKFCYKQNKYIHREGVENCYMALEEKKKKIPNGSYYVRFVRKGYAYVEIGDRVVKIKDSIGNIDNYVYAVMVNGEYQISLSPIAISDDNTTEDKPKKRQYNRKKK